MVVDRSGIRLWRLGGTRASRFSSKGGKNWQISSMSYLAKEATAVLAETPRRGVSAPNEAGISVPITESRIPVSIQLLKTGTNCIKFGHIPGIF